jgi:hypothetical protein
MLLISLLVSLSILPNLKQYQQGKSSMESFKEVWLIQQEQEGSHCV